ncbi:Leucine-rich repeat LGI family member 2 LGI1-like protein 2 [Triplophysa tibetana]|uniref:Leucine-rich repeat LGI family member 2 LGI1-like protein 2 n=1 Tax=Triplophysa tibetana TaxID=1572043 RepID=A0A5A9PS23_9TELE|nr:Leucine-rich repeat LGI family member 2 LGI1-like protein 2 [Triplophysa tibetana]
MEDVVAVKAFWIKEELYLAITRYICDSKVLHWTAKDFSEVQDDETKIFERFKEVYIQAPHSFTVVSTDRRDFIFASSFKGSTQIFEHIIINLRRKSR